jgi:hypothetical protein
VRRKSIPDCGYLFKTATHWRMRAEKMRTLTAEARNPAVRAMMRRIAADYDRFARNADDRAAQDSIISSGGAPMIKQAPGVGMG